MIKRRKHYKRLKAKEYGMIKALVSSGVTIGKVATLMNRSHSLVSVIKRTSSLAKYKDYCRRWRDKNKTEDEPRSSLDSKKTDNAILAKLEDILQELCNISTAVTAER